MAVKATTSISLTRIDDGIEIANGKSTVIFSTTPPPITGRKVDDVWFDTDDGNKMYKFSGTAWVEQTFGTNAITAGAITTAKLDAEAVTAAKIAAGTIVAGNIATDAVTAIKILAGSITTDKLDVNAVTAGKIDALAVQTKHLDVGAVTAEKISTGAITSDKMDTEELFVGDNAFIKSLKAVEISANNIVADTISNERLNLKGFINFEAFDEDLSNLYIPTEGGNTMINGGFIGTDTIKANSIDLYSGLTVRKQDGSTSFSIAENGDVSVNGLLRSGNYKAGVSGYQVETTGRAEFNEAVIRGSIDLPNAGLTNSGANEFNPVRIWAGSSYDNRELAPFKVRQDGSLTALDGTFTGRVYGNYDNDKIHIHDNEIVIDGVSTFLDYNGQERTITPMDVTSDDPHIKLSAGQSILNTDVIFGSSNDKRMEFSNDGRALLLNNSLIYGARATGNIKINDGSKEGHFNGIEFNGKTGGSHMIGYYDEASFLKFESKGNAYHPSGRQFDFVFEGAGERQGHINMLVDGDVTVEKAVKSQKQNIEMRSVANEGWGFYAT